MNDKNSVDEAIEKLEESGVSRKYIDYSAADKLRRYLSKLVESGNEPDCIVPDQRLSLEYLEKVFGKENIRIVPTQLLQR